MNHPSSQSLIDELDKRLTTLKSSEERLDLLEGLLDLRDNRMIRIEATVLMKISDYFDYIEFMINDEKAGFRDLRKNIPHLPDCFKDPSSWLHLIKNPKLSDYNEDLGDGKYKWTGPLNALGGFASELYRKNYLKPEIKSAQEHAKIFCTYFNVSFNEKEEKSFQANRANSEPFKWIPIYQNKP